MTQQKTVLVVGATGNQGGATARHLLQSGWQVRALVRDPAKPAARALQDLGATLVTGDMEDADSLRTAMDSVHGVFSVQALAHEPDTLAAEVRQGKTVADVATQSGVKHLIYSSVGGADRHTGIEHFESKAEIERHIRALGLPATILRPVFFMDNLLYYADAADERVLKLPVLPDRPMQMIASDDIGLIAAHAFDHPADLGQQIEIAGDEVTFTQVAEIYEKLTGTPTRLEPQPIDGRMFEWFAESGYEADIADLRRRFPTLLTLEEFLRSRLATGR
ncbi:NmrA family protein [Micromonospora sp. ATCC 39149]|uniref:NmrA/HSCARG family protein n=1 Tax=Micromonospora carbonacea TaxID=47853 RepID=A0A7D5YIW3_9ACTN|nr:NmrA/HSCARG family protein [Micromonospora sp. ATCC 39149]EEP74788.1 NmrA family protein [Micromonospora sp. ATCC 39149]QLK00577.1 NmrA/HSCARG family protein [Micromonospora carbonacea]